MNWVDGVVRDLKYGLRMMRNARLISIAVVVTLAVGIGINAGIFTVINGTLLRPRVDSEPSTFARLYAQYWSRGNPREFGGYFSPADYRALQARSHSLSELAAWRTDGVMVAEDATRTLVMEVSCNFFAVYGLDRPVLGRLFRSAECAPGSEEPVAVVAGELWRDRFASDPHLVGKTILLNRLPFTVVGITPIDFSGRLRGPGIWVPYTLQHRLTGNDDIFAADLKPSLWLEGRLLRGHSRDQLQAEANVIVSQVPAQDPNLKQRVLVTNGAMIEDPIVRENAFWIILLILTGAMLLLLVSCASGAVLLLSRAVARQQEIAVRISIGAARRRILQQLLSENLLLAVAAGGLGVYLALEIPQAFRMLNSQMPHFAFGLDWHVFGYLAVLTFTSSTMAGLVPALESLKQDVWLSLKGHEPVLQAARLRWSLRDLLVIVQVCFCVVLMVVSVMFSQAVLSIFSMEPGFETRHVLAVPLELPPARYSPSDAEEFYKTVQERIAAVGPVDQVATSSIAPLAGELAAQAASPNSAEFHLPIEQSAEGHTATIRAVSRNYFAALGIPLVRGEGFPNTEGDGSQAIISQAFAAAFWPRQDPIGETVVSADGKRLRVIGVVRDNRTRYTREADGPTVYTLRSKAERGDLLLVRFHGDSDPIALAVKGILHDLDPQMFVLSSTLRAQMDDNAERGWQIGKLLLGVAGVAGILALLGIYGIVGYSVTKRTREFGIRSALGATPRDVMQLVFALGIRPVIAGIFAGTACAFVFSMAVVSILREAPLPLSSTTPGPYLEVAASLIMAALLAMIGHARRAAGVQPLIALREQ